MLGFIVRRGLQAGLLLLLVSVLAFIGVYAVGKPGGVLADPRADPQERERASAARGDDQPLWLRYPRFLAAALHGDLGRSQVRNVPALGLMLERLPATLELAVAATLIALILGAPLGLWAGLAPETGSGRFIMAGSMLGISLPAFWVGLLLIMVFSVMLGWLPPGGRGPTTLLGGVAVSFLSLAGWRHLVLPATSLALFELALLTRLTSASTRRALLEQYFQFARAKGLTQARVIGVHLLRNLVLPIVAVLGLEFGSVIGFAIVTESVFDWPGMGKLLVESIKLLDRPTIAAYLLVTAFLVIVSKLIFDVLYSALDPRMRPSASKG
jgi:peptide/nickel transport system permease protein